MKKAAIFVEGHTEAAFVRELVTKIGGVRGVNFIGEDQNRGVFIQKYQSYQPDNSFEVLIANCCNDAAVVTYIRERYQALTGAGYELILGLRDLYRLTHAELPRLKQGMKSVTPTGSVPVHIIVAVAEVEAWFIEEITHFLRLDTRLTEAGIKAATGYTLGSRAAENIPHPAGLLHDAYQVAGMAWHKTAAHVARTLGALDFAYLQNDSRHHSQSMDEFFTHIEDFFA